jgi:hypothetical protein
MNARISLLAGLFGMQLLIIVAVYSMGGGSSTAAKDLVSFDPSQVTSVRILEPGTDEGEAVEVSLTRTESGWELADGLPADGDKIQSLLEKLASFSAPWPVATSADSAERFEVTEGNHQRRVVVGADSGEVADLYFGTSPGYRRVHARNASSDEIYSVDFSNYETPADNDEWLLKTLLEADGQVREVSRVDAWSVSRTDDGWLIDSEAADTAAVDRVVNRFTDLRVTGLGEGKGEATASFKVTDGAGEYHLTVYYDEAEDVYEITSDRRAGRYAIANYIVEQLIVDASSLQAADEAARSDMDAAGPDETVDGEP